jgi:hypothetical protein
MSPLPSWFRPWAEIEATATQLRLFEHSLVPGLLQTEDYAQAVLVEEPNTSADQTAQLVAARLSRQAALARDGRPLVWALIDEAALNRPVGGATVMHEQLLHLASIAEKPNVTVQVMPVSTGAHCCLTGAFAVADVDGAGPSAYLETVTDGYIADSPPVVAKVILKFDSLRSEALTRTESRAMILKRAEGYGSDQGRLA